MKKTTLFLTVTLMCCGLIFAQQPQVPDFKNSPMILKKDGSLEKLEKQNSEIKVKKVPYVGTTRFISITGGKSPVRVGTDAVFIVKVDAETDPETVFYLQASKGGSKNREIDMEKISQYASYGAKGKSVKKDQLPISYDKVSPGVYKITITGLKAGTEYAFVDASQGASGAHSTVFLFGVD
jgi:hypothetical protein